MCLILISANMTDNGINRKDMLIYLITFLLLNPMVACDTMLVYKRYNQSLSLGCPGCHTNECPVSINGIDATPTAAIQSDQLILRSGSWDSYGTVCCGDMDQQDCYKVCPPLTEICEDCLTLSSNVTVVAVGGVVMIVSSMLQQPHNGISLFVDGVAYTNVNLDFRCHTTSKILGQQMVYYCTGRKTGTVTVHSNTVFCDTELSSQQIVIIIEEQSVTTQDGVITANIIPSTSSDVIRTMTVATSTPSINNTISITSTATSGPTDTGSSDGTIAIVITIFIAIILGLLLTAVALFILGRLCGYRFSCRFLASGDKETASAAEEGQNGNLANADIHDTLQPRGPPSPFPSYQYPVQQQPTDTADLEILQLPDQRLNYLPCDA